MRRHCDGTDPNLLQADGRTPCACGLTFDDVEMTVIHPHTPVQARLLSDAWVWTPPRDGELVPDHPPRRLPADGLSFDDLTHPRPRKDQPVIPRTELEERIAKAHAEASGLPLEQARDQVRDVLAHGPDSPYCDAVRTAGIPVLKPYWDALVPIVRMVWTALGPLLAEPAAAGESGEL